MREFLRHILARPVALALERIEPAHVVRPLVERLVTEAQRCRAIVVDLTWT